MIESSKVHKILYGGDYNPEQWPEEIWKEDMRLFKLAHIDVVTLNVFSWAALQPDEITYDFSKLDKIMEYVKENGLKVLEEVCPLSARMVVNQVSMKMEDERIRNLIRDLRKVIDK